MPSEQFQDWGGDHLLPSAQLVDVMKEALHRAYAALLAKRKEQYVATDLSSEQQHDTSFEDCATSITKTIAYIAVQYWRAKLIPIIRLNTR
eukprot:1451905-Amphidinium_carterae.1